MHYYEYYVNSATDLLIEKQMFFTERYTWRIQCGFIKKMCYCKYFNICLMIMLQKFKVLRRDSIEIYVSLYIFIRFVSNKN